MSLWSAMVVSVEAHGSGGGRPTVPLAGLGLGGAPFWSTSGPQTSDPLVVRSDQPYHLGRHKFMGVINVGRKLVLTRVRLRQT